MARRGWKPIKIVDCLFFYYGIFVIDLINENQGNGRVCKFKIKPRKVHRGHIKGSKSLSQRSIELIYAIFVIQQFFRTILTTSILFTHKCIIFKNAVIDFKWVLTT